MLQLQSALGIFALLAFAWLISEDRRAVSWRQAAIGLAVTFATAVILLKVPGVATAFAAINDAVGAIGAASRAGTSFVFGYLGGGPLPFELKVPGAEFVLALQALPVVLVMSVLTTLLFYWRILPPIVRGFSWLLERTLGVGGAVGLSTAANIFLGMVEAPLFIRPYLAKLTPRRAVHRDDRRHGRHRRHRAGALRHPDRPGHSRRGRASRGRLRARRAGRDPGQPDHGPRCGRQAYRRHARRSGTGGVEHHGRDREGHRRRARAAAQHLRHADRAGRAGASRQRHAGRAADRRRRADHACSACSAW